MTRMSVFGPLTLYQRYVAHRERCACCGKFHEGEEMENQHRKISGYRELDQAEIDLMNEIKAQGIALGALVDKLRAASTLDQRWVSIGATDLQTGLMALTRGVAKPTFF